MLCRKCLLMPILWMVILLFCGISEGAKSDRDELAKQEIRQEIDNLTRAIDSGELPDDYLSFAYRYRGILYSNLYILNLAIKDLELSVKTDPENAAAYVDLGIVYGKLNKFDKAIRLYDKAIMLNRESSYAYMNKGYALFYSEQYEEALKLFKRSIELDPKDTYRYLWEFITTDRLGKPDKNTLRRRLQNHRNNQWPENLCKLFLGDLRPEDILQQPPNTDKMPENHFKCEAFFFIGQYYLAKGDKEKAEKYFQKTVSTEVLEFLEYGYAKKELNFLLQ